MNKEIYENKEKMELRESQIGIQNDLLCLKLH